MRGIAISGNQVPTLVPSDLLAAFRPAVRAVNHEFAPPLYTKDGANFFLLFRLACPIGLSVYAARTYAQRE